MRYRLTLAYRGTLFGGWQRQPNARTVQEELEKGLSALLGVAVRSTGASRTDAGVHARGQVAHVDLDREFPSRGLVHGTNHHLPEDVRVLAATPAPPDFHARYSAVSKEYHYRLLRVPVLSPLDAPFAVRAPLDLDLEALRRATVALCGRHDFGAFALAGGAHRSPVRTIATARWEEDGEELSLCIVGDGFLRGMVRGIVGTLLEVGQGRRSVESVTALLGGRPRGEAGPTAPPQGLVLHQVSYGERGAVVA
ncbi:MAG: tRNA pseudouridine(38-40) synthase TruA [Acidobacteriota bacterium]